MHGVYALRTKWEEKYHQKINKLGEHFLLFVIMLLLCIFHHKLNECVQMLLLIICLLWAFVRKYGVVDYSLIAAEIPQGNLFFHSVPGKDRSIVMKMDILMRVLLA